MTKIKALLAGPWGEPIASMVYVLICLPLAWLGLWDAVVLGCLGWIVGRYIHVFARLFTRW